MTGNIPPVVDKEIISDIWNFLKEKTQSKKDIPPPRIHFMTFNASLADKKWVLWQQKWLYNTLPGGRAFNPSFSGFYYLKTNIVQIDPARFSEAGNRNRLNSGYYLVAHEMLHYLFSVRGIPPYIHHCLMVRGEYGIAVGKYMVHRGADPIEIAKKITQEELFCDEYGVRSIQAELFEKSKTPPDN